MNNSRSYRPDIDGLRAVAVLSVIGFHYGIGPLKGGFAGVDIFFVISGYLVTRIVHNEVQCAEFTFVRFYSRRARRILPALIGMLLAVIIVGAVLLLPSDLRRLGENVAATLIGASNIVFWRNSGYFDPSSHLNPLLHTWSLAVEEQFYAVLPLVIVVAERFARRYTKLILLTVGIVSLVLCISLQPVRPTAVFYLSPFRGWEFIVGGLLGIGALPAIASRLVRETLAACALAVLVASLLWLDEGASFPGWVAIFPVAATAALLHCGASGENSVRRVLSLRPLVQVGLISYSLYLWHWPILVFGQYANGMESLSTTTLAVLLAATLLLSWASYAWIEVPFRRNRSAVPSEKHIPFSALALAGTVAIGLLAGALWLGNGWPSRVPAVVAAMDGQRFPEIPYSECDSSVPREGNAACMGGKADGLQSILLWGDSHALAWSPALDEIGRRAGMKVLLAPNSACPPLFDVKNPVDPDCLEQNNRVREFVRRQKPDYVVMVASWLSYSIPNGFYSLEDMHGRVGNGAVFTKALSSTIDELGHHTRRIILIGPTPSAPGDIPFRLAQALWRGAAKPSPNSAATQHELSRWFWRAAAGLDPDKTLLVDPTDWFCNDRECQYEDDAGTLLYRDSGHLSREGASFVASKFPIGSLNGSQTDGRLNEAAGP